MTTISLSDCHDCYYVPGAFNIIDVINPLSGLTVFTKETHDEVRKRHPSAIRTTVDDASKLINGSAKSEPQEITHEEWDDALNVLPPLRWINRMGAETFRMSEFYCGTVTNTYVRIGERYAKWRDDISVTHDELARRALALFNSTKGA